MENKSFELATQNQQQTVQALKDIDCIPVINSDGTVSFKFQGEHFYVQFGEKVVAIWNFEIMSLDINDDQTNDILEAIKFTNGHSFPTFIVTSPNKDGEIMVSLEYRFYNDYTEDYPKFLYSILKSFFDVRDLLWTTYADYLQNKGRPSRWKTPEIGYVSGSNRKLDINYYLENIRGTTHFPPNNEVEEDTDKKSESPETDAAKRYLDNIHYMNVLNHWYDYLVKIGCQPFYEQDTGNLAVKYQGQYFEITCDQNGVTIANFSMVRFMENDSLTMRCFREALKDVYSVVSPKLVLAEPAFNGELAVNAVYNLFIDFNFHDENWEFKNLETLTRILDSFTQARCNLIFYMQTIRSKILKSQEENNESNN